MSNATISLLSGEFWAFLRVRKKWWLAPIVVMLVLLGALIFFTQGSARRAVHLHDFLKRTEGRA